MSPCLRSIHSVVFEEPEGGRRQTQLLRGPLEPAVDHDGPPAVFHYLHPLLNIWETQYNGELYFINIPYHTDWV